MNNSSQQNGNPADGAAVQKSKFAQMEEEIIQYWNEIDAFKRSVDERSEENQYVFYDGPPFATGLPHYGSLLGSIVKDVVPRYKTMRGYRVERKWGWDCHGLPIENMIEKEMGLNSRRDIEEYGIDKFNAACSDAIFAFDAEWKKIIKRVGRWVDMESSYKTMDNSYMESVWWGFKELYTKGLVYEGRRVSLYCSRCGTPLSNFEIAMDNSYKDVKDNSVFWKFPIVGQEDTSLVAWTTTPWSTPGTVGLAVGADFTYVKAKIAESGEYIIFVKDRLDFVMKGLEEDAYEIVEEFKGSELVGLSYEPIMDSYKELPEVAGNDNAYKVFAEDYVEVEEGTGLVTINGSYGEIDMESAQRNSLPMVFDVNEEGKYNAIAGKYADQPIKEAEVQLLEDMEAAGRVWRTEKYKHSYPHCWRCDTPLFYFATPAWFVNVQKIKERMLELNQDINWLPGHLKEGRFAKGIETAPDWNISRSRFWGTGIPVWKCEDDNCSDIDVIGSVAEIEEKSGKQLGDMDLHRPYIDDITWDCSDENCNGQMKRIPEVFDCWVESGSMPFASQHYPFENKEKFEAFYPAEFISEYINQTRGWFYTLHVLSTGIFDKPSFTNVVTSGMLLAEDGNKMSKSKKNYPDPVELFNEYSVDALRAYLMASPLMDASRVRFSEREVNEMQRKYINTIWNVFTFYKMFADQVEESGQSVDLLTDASELTHVLDKWVLARTYGTLKHVTESYEAYNIRQTVSPIQDLVQDISTWYLRRSRDRFKGEDAADKLMALRTLKTVLLLVSKMAAPVTPFIAENIYLKVRDEQAPDSVHLCMWPEVDEAFFNETALEEMTVLRKHVESVLALRSENKLKVRQPLASATIAGWNAAAEGAEQYELILREELNVKAILSAEEYAIDTELSEELLLEGLLREMVRQTNALRKKARLSIGDYIEVKVHTTNDMVKKVLEVHGEEYQKSVLATSAVLVEEAQEHTLKMGEGKTTLSW